MPVLTGGCPLVRPGPGRSARAAGRFGLASRKPKRLRQMDTFVNDNLIETVCDGDLLLQICATSRTRSSTHCAT